MQQVANHILKTSVFAPWILSFLLRVTSFEPVLQFSSLLISFTLVAVFPLKILLLSASAIFLPLLLLNFTSLISLIPPTSIIPSQV